MFSEAFTSHNFWIYWLKELEQLNNKVSINLTASNGSDVFPVSSDGSFCSDLESQTERPVFSIGTVEEDVEISDDVTSSNCVMFDDSGMEESSRSAPPSQTGDSTFHPDPSKADHVTAGRI